MLLPLNERKSLLAYKGVGPFVVARLAKSHVLGALHLGARRGGSIRCKSSPQACAATGAAPVVTRACHAH